MIVTDCHTLPEKLFWLCNSFGRQATFFLNTDFQNIELQNSFLSSVNDNGDNSKKKYLKTWMGIFKNMGGNFPGGSFPDTGKTLLHQRRSEATVRRCFTK